MRLNIPQIDSKKANGIWIDYTDTVKFKICRFGSAHADKVKHRLLKELRDGMTEGKTVTEEENNNYINRIYAEGVILDWKGLIDLDTKKPIKYSPAMAYKIISNEENVGLFNFIATNAEKMENFSKDAAKKSAKKRKTS